MEQIKIKLKPYAKQREIIFDKSRFKVICAGRRVGKSILCHILAIKDLLAGRKVCYITSDYTLVRKEFDDISEKLPDGLIQKQNKSTFYIKLITGGELKFFSGEVLNKVRGWEFDLLIVDEAAHISDLESGWTYALRPILLKTRGNVVFISSPKGKNFFYSLFQKGINGDDGFKSWKFSTHLNPFVATEELDELRISMTEAAYQQEILAEPGENISNPFGTDAIERNTIKTLPNTNAIIYGIDFGRVNDWTVIIGLDSNGHTCYFDRFKLTWEQTIERVKKLRLVDPHTMIVVDSTGVGSVLLERLQVHIYNVIGFEFTGKSKPIIIHDLIKDIEGDKLKINEITAQEMNTYEFKYTSGGNLSYNAASGYHDDCIAALAMANHYRKKNVGHIDFFTF